MTLNAAGSGQASLPQVDAYDRVASRSRYKRMQRQRMCIELSLRGGVISAISGRNSMTIIELRKYRFERTQLLGITIVDMKTHAQSVVWKLVIQSTVFWFVVMRIWRIDCSCCCAGRRRHSPGTRREYRIVGLNRVNEKHSTYTSII